MQLQQLILQFEKNIGDCPVSLICYMIRTDLKGGCLTSTEKRWAKWARQFIKWNCKKKVMTTTRGSSLKFYATIALCTQELINSLEDNEVGPTYLRKICYWTIIRTGFPFHIFVFIMCTFMCVFLLFIMLVGVQGDIYSKKMASSEL